MLCSIVAFVLKGNLPSLITIFLHINLVWLSLGFICIFFYWLIEAITLYMMLTHQKRHITFKEVFKLIVSTQFFNGITPFSSGGQPFQIYILTKESQLDASIVTSASLNNFIVYQFVLVFLGSIAVFFKYFYSLFTGITTQSMNAVALLGFILNLVVICALLLVSTQLNITRSIIFTSLKLLTFTPLKKKSLELQPKIDRFLVSFHKNSQGLLLNKSLLAKTSLLNIIKLIVFYLIAYFVCRSIGFDQISILQAVTASAYIMLITSFVPLPGASGGSEAGFIILFGSFLTLPQVTVVMLLWRFITYYLGMFVGMLTYFFGYKKSMDLS